jgi:hypothetical protein
MQRLRKVEKLEEGRVGGYKAACSSLQGRASLHCKYKGLVGANDMCNKLLELNAAVEAKVGCND